MVIPSDPHGGTPTLAYGVPPEQARAAMILLHGRGASPEDILGIGAEVGIDNVVYLAPAAMNSTWYPYPFLNPQVANQPWLDSALQRVGGLIAHLNGVNIPTNKIMLLGFSQGACLASEYAARYTQRYGGVAALSGGLIGADDDLTGYIGSLDETPVFFGCSDVDPHIPEARVQRSAEIMQALGAKVETRIFPGMGHLVNLEEIGVVRGMLEALIVE
jgi:phospholipase/carboxylesterase